MAKIYSRMAKKSDLNDLFKISIETFTTAFAHLNNPDDFQAYIEENKYMDALSKEMDNPDSVFFLFSTKESPLCAYCKINFSNAQSDIRDPKSLEIERIYVYNAFQKQGVGAEILTVCEELAKSKGLSYIWLGVWEKNPDAIRFYERQGYQAFSTHPFVIGNDVQTDILMKKDLA